MTKLFKMIAAASFLHVASLGNPRFRVVQSIPARVRTVGGGAGHRTPAADSLAEGLRRKTVKQLRGIATAMKIKGRSKARRKADLVKLIADARRSDR